MPSHESRHIAAAAQPLDDNAAKKDPLLGQLLADRYRLFSLLGEGGMGRVYMGEHALMRKRVAVKILHKELTQVPEVVARFEREAMAAANIEHPNVAAATDFGKAPDGSVFLVLEYVQGKSLRNVVEEGPLPIARALHIARQIAAAVAAAHALGIVHRDLKPENVMLVEKNGDRDFVKVLDFGIAKVPVQDVSERGSIRPAKVITRVGMIFGTPEYMAPEQALGQNVDARADVYAMGIMLFEMLCGKRPFSANSPVGILGQQLQGPLPRFAQRAPQVRVPTALEQLVHRLLAPAASARLPSALDLVAALDDARALLRTKLPDTTKQTPASSGYVPNAKNLLGRIGRSDDASAMAKFVERAAAAGEPPAVNASTLPAPTHHEGRTTANGFARPATRRMEGWTQTFMHNRLLSWGLASTLVVGSMLGAWQVWHGRHKPTVPVPASVSAAVSQVALAAPAPTPILASDAQLNAARGEGVPALRKLADTYPHDTRALAELAKAQFAIGNAGDCLDSIKAAFAADPHTSQDANLATLLWKMAQKRETTERTVNLLQTGFGERGIDILYDLTTTAAVRTDVRLAASRNLYSVRAQEAASPALRVVLELEHATKCEEKLALLATAARDGDARIMPMLTVMHTMTGCGKGKRQDCYPCLRHGLELENAISAVKKRAQ